MELSDAQRKKYGLIVTELANVGAFLREHGHPRRAIQVFLTLATDDPTFETGDYAHELGLCHEALGEDVAARKYFDIAARENPALYGAALGRRGDPK